MQGDYVSIIIPTYKDWARLRLCLAALANQTYPVHLFEVLVVNNDPDEDRPPADFWLPENARVLSEKKPGSYAARNAALQAAKGEIIGFTDSDCIPDKDWIKNAVAYLRENKSCSRIAGHIAIFSKLSRATFSEKYEKVYGFQQKLYVEKYKYGATGNMFTYKNIFDTVGLFDEKLFSSGDFAWGKKAHLAGYAVHYVENVVVKHPARSLQELVRKARRQGGGAGIRAMQTPVKFLDFIHLLNGFRPRIAEIKYLYNKNTGLNAIDKIKIFLVRHYLLNVRDFEKLKVKMGKKPNRT